MGEIGGTLEPWSTGGSARAWSSMRTPRLRRRAAHRGSRRAPAVVRGRPLSTSDSDSDLSEQVFAGLMLSRRSGSRAARAGAAERGRDPRGDGREPLARLQPRARRRRSDRRRRHDAIRATTGRTQNKAHVEGRLRAVCPEGATDRARHARPATHARTIVQLVATTFCRALNRAPRRDRSGKPPRRSVHSAGHARAARGHPLISDDARASEIGASASRASPHAAGSSW